MRNTTKPILFLSGLLLLTITSCKKFIDINRDPNNPTTPVLTLLLPSTQVSLAGNMNGVNEGATTVMQQLVSTIDRYQQTGASFNGSWNGFYTQTIPDIQTVIRQGTQQQQWGFVAVAKLEKAYLYSMLVDLWGDVPYTQASKGSEVPSPALENGAAIYDSIFNLIDGALADMDKGFAIAPTSSDVIYAGSADKWKRMANSLKLKLFNQIRLADPARAAAGIKALIANPATLITDNSQDFTFRFGSSISPNNRHPWYNNEYRSGKSYYQNQAFINRLFNADDMRLRYFIYRQNATVGIYNSANGNGYYGRPPADPTASPADQSTRATIGIYPAGGLYDNGNIKDIPATYQFFTNTGATGTQRVVANTDGTGAGMTPLITNAMVKFIRAEAALTLSTGENAKQLFLDAVTANLNSISTFAAANGGLAMTNISSFVNRLASQYDAAASDNARLNLIITQKYIAQFGNGIESYNDYRRTGYPQLDPLLSPLNVFPLRFYYTTTELATNTTLSGATGTALQVAQQTKPVFWDK
ncbi:MAG: SusD/RagB family nutrient-binding outer membrane lipoprotein [Williamsia sp.]|nr:SusD/RagB family nutrient-binding outer membrane lipoprotein [Williamsia sp.]